MKKTTFLKVILLAFIFLQSFISYSQSLVSYVSRSEKDVAIDFFRIENNTVAVKKAVLTDEKLSAAVGFMAVDENPVKKYAQLPYAGQVSICPNNGKELPKLFLCGGNDSRLIETGLTIGTGPTNVQSITWQRFISGGSCITVSNSDCANESAAPACWVQIATGKDYLANTAGQFRVIIVDALGTPFIYYFNVYQNNLIPTAVAKSDIVTYGTGTCKINGRITVGGFGSGYEYSFTTGTAPGTWQDSNVFTTSTPGNYTAFIRIKGIVGSCEFKVINLDIKSVNFVVTTSITSPKCSGAQGSIQVITNDIKQQYKYEIFNSANALVGTFGPTEDLNHPFTGLNPGTYRLVTSVVGIGCMIDTKSNITITSPTQLTATADITNGLSACNDTGEITVTVGGGTTPYKYFVNINGAGFVSNGISNKIKTVSSGTYVVRVEDANGCFIDTAVTVPTVDKPTYTIIKIDSKCKDDKGQIRLDIIDAKGYTIEYSINNGGNYFPGNTVFSNLAADNYIVIVRYKRANINNGNNCADPSMLVQIGGTKALTASSGVAELAGCRPGGAGQARITNVEGGTAPYQYSFDGGISWGISPEKDLMPGTYSLAVRDANDCVFAMEAITIDEIPQKPVITVDSPVFNCDGTATTTVTVTNNGGPKYAYQYYNDGNPNIPINSGVFTNVSQGDHTITVAYTVLSVSTYSNLLKEDFGSGASTTTPGIATAYCFNDQRVVGPYNCGTRSVEDNQYSVTNDFWRSDDSSASPAWFHYKDHTTSPGNKAGLPLDPKGRFLLVNIGSAAGPYGVLYSKPIKDVVPYQPVVIDVYLGNLLRSNRGGAFPDFIIELVDGSGVVVASQATGIIPNNELWNLKTLSLDPGNNTNLTFKIRSGSILYGGNDAVIDDILVYQLPKSCNTVASFPIVVDGSKAFAASITGYKDVQCNGEKNGEITLSAKNFDPVKGFQYQVDGGSWITVIPSPAATSGSVTLPNLPDKIYNINIRYDNSTGSCTFPVAQEIKNPTALEIKAEITKVATCIVGATITAVATEGTPGYQYQLIKADGSILFPFQVSGIFIDVPVGDYTVVAQDLNACQTAIPASVSVVAAIPPTATFEPSNLCFDANAEIKIKVTGGVGPYTYTTSFDGGTPTGPSATFDGPSFTYTAAVAGIYTFEVTDSFGCKTAVISQTINAKLTTVTPVTTALDCDVAPADQAVITGTISGGTAPFVVTLVSGNATGTLDQPTAVATANERTFTYSIAVAGTYNFEIKDANNCVTTSETTINALTAITLGSTNVNPKCNGSADGTIQLNPGGGSGGFKYSEDGTTYNDKSFFTGLSAGSYTYYVIDSNKCTKSITITLIAPDPVIGTATITTPYTCDNAATITVSGVSGGNGTYKYTLNKDGVAGVAQDSKVFNGITAAGSYTVTIADSNGCPFTTTPALSIVALNKPAAMTINKSALTCPTNKVDFTITDVKDALGAPLTGPFKYSITAPASAITNNTTGIFNLDPGITYTFEVRDANNCFYTKTDKIDPLPVFTVDPTSHVDITCLNAVDGSAIFTVSDFGNGIDYTYQIDGALPLQTGTSPTAGTSFTIATPNLNAGLHTLTVTNTVTKCSKSGTVTIATPTAALTLDPTTITDVTCKANGTAEIKAKGGWGTYTYVVTGPAPAVTVIPASTPKNTFVNLVAGVYSFTVTDLKGCQVSDTFTIKDKELPFADFDGTSVYCAGGAGATLVVVPTVSPQPNYRYSINGSTPPQVSGTFGGLTPGKYTIRVSDILTGCYIDLAEQTIASPVTASTKLLKDLDCNATNPDASIEVTIANGYPTYTYKVAITTGVPSFTGSATTVGATGVFTYPAPTAGTYHFEITDSKGCKTVVSRIINAKVDPTATTTPTNPTCFNGTDGSITVNASLGTAPYTYEVSTTTATGLFVAIASNIYSNAGAGNYYFRITDAKKCTFVTAVTTLTNPSELKATAAVTTPLTCGVGNASQAAIITVTIDPTLIGTPYSGVNKYRYSYNGGTPVTSNTYTTSAIGTVSVIVYDANNCPYTVPVLPDVKALDPPTTMTFAKANDITCDATKLDTDLTVSFLNGVSPFTVEITSTDAAIAPVTPVVTGVTGNSHTFTNLSPGTYFFKVTDANNCTLTGQFKIDSSVPVQVTGSLVKNVTCNAGTDGSIKFDVTNTSTVGTIDVILTDGVTTITPTSITNAGKTYTYTGLPQGTYTFTATNNVTKCSDTKQVTVSQPAAITGLAATATKVFSCMTLPKTTTIKVSALGGASPLYYAVVKLGAAAPVFPTDYNTTGIFTKDTGVDGLEYDVYVVDQYGNCPQKLNPHVTVEDDRAPTVDPVADTCYPGASFAVTVGGTVYVGSSVQYGIGTTATNIVYTAVATKNISAPGTYFVGVKDDNGCTATTSFVVSNQLTITPKLDKDLTCSLPAEAKITLSATGGTGTYTYEYKVGTGGTFTPFPAVPGNVYNPTLAGDYYFRVTSGLCDKETTAPIVVTDHVDPELKPITQTQFIKCSGDETAAIKIELVAGKGVGPFVYNVKQYSDLAHTLLVKDYGTQTTGLAAGYYVVTVTDAKGCTDSKFITIAGKDPINFDDLTKLDIQCATGGVYSLGSIFVKNVTGGTAPYKYFITNNYGDIIPGNPYTTNVGPDFNEDYTFSGIINFGVYTINVVDANGCSFSKQITMTSPPSDLKIVIDTSAPSCSSGSATVTVKALPLGTNYTFGIFESNIPPFSSNFLPANNGPDSRIFTGLTPGVTYTFVVHDGNTGCDFVNTADIAIPAASTLIPAITPHNVTCIGENDGYVSFSVTGFDATTTSIDYQIFKGLSNAAVSGVLSHTIGDPFPVNYPTLPALPAPQVGNLVPGPYYIVFTERGGTKDGCTIASKVFDIKESSIELSVTASVFKNENCNDLGIIIAEAKDGTPGYMYLANTTGTPPLATDSGWQSSGALELTAGTYYIFAKDANGCIQQAAATVKLDKDPEPDFVLSVPSKCAAEGSFTVDVTITDTTLLVPPTPSMGDFYVSVNGGGFVPVTGLTYSATGLNSGEQKIIIQDKNGCTVEKKITINATPLATAVVSKPLDCSVDPLLVENATITVTISEGTTPYTYEVKQGAGAYATITPTVTVVAGVTTFDYSVGAANTYQFRITDANTCPVETTEVIVDAIVPFNSTPNLIEPLCNLGNNGSIELVATGGKGNYTYTLQLTSSSPIGAVVSQNTPMFTGLVAGDYLYTITDELGCGVTDTVTLGEPTAVVGSANVTTPLTCGPGNVGQAATVTLSGAGGSGTYEYSFNNSAFSGQTTYTVNDNGADQTFAYAVRDVNGCEDPGTVTVLKLDPPTNFDIAQGPDITCATLSTTVTISNVENGAGLIPNTVVLTYQIISSTSLSPIRDNGTDPVFINLLPGTYVFQVTDEVGCVKQIQYEIKAVINIDIVEQSTTGITCLGTDDGKASFLVSGFTGTYHYEVDGTLVTISGVSNFTDTTINVTGLAAGAHTIEVFDDITTCPKLIPFTIDAPALALTLDPLNVTPLGCTTKGAVTVTAQGGWGNYEYTLTPPVGSVVTNNTGIFDNLTDISAAYTVSVTDANGCTVSDNFTLVTPTPPTAIIGAASDYCYDEVDFATLVVTPSGGAGGYEFSIDNGVSWQTSATFDKLTPESYDITVKDAYGCEVIVSNNVIAPQLFATAENKKDIFCGPVDGTITISALGGYGSYNYTITKDTDPTSASIAFPVGSDTADYSVAAPGTYVFVVYDAQGCSYTVTNAIVMKDPTPVVFTAVPTSPSCAGTQGELADGSILVTLDPASTDNPDYTYTIVRTVPTAYTKTQVNNGLFTGLIAGTYDVTVTSARDCPVTIPVTITDPILVEAAASATPFTCTAPNTLNETIVTVTGKYGTGTGLVTDYTYSENGTNWETTNTFKVINNGATQNPVYYVRDANGCIDDVTIPITAFPKLTSPNVTFGTLIDCNNKKQAIDVVINGGRNTPNQFTYQAYKDGVVDGGLVTVVGNTFTYDAVTVGSYYEFEIFDNNTGCSIKSTSYEVPVFNKIKVFATTAANVDCNGNATGAIEINIVDYKGPYAYEILKGGVSLTPAVTGVGNSSVTSSLLLPHGLIAGTDYTVSILETAFPECSAISNVVVITEPAALDLTGFKVNVKNQNCTNKVAVLTIDESTIVGGTKGFKYTYVPTTTPPTIPADGDYKIFTTIEIATATIAPAFDSYDVYVKDAQGCFDFVTVKISQDPMPTVTATVASQCASPYTINVVGTGVTTPLAPLEYSLDGNSFTTATALTVALPGDYTVWVRDANTCTATTTTLVTIFEPLQLGYDITETPICEGTEGEVTLRASGGTIPANYEYSNDGTAYSSAAGANVFGGLAPSAIPYTFYVRDMGTNCVKTVDVIIEKPNTAIAFTLIPKDAICNGDSNGSITVNMAAPTTAKNNNPVYTFAISPVEGTLVGNVFTNLPQGVYTVTVTSGKGCPVTATETVGEPQPIVVAAPIVTDFGCTKGNITDYATITVPMPTGGSTVYKVYEFIKNGTLIPVQRGENPIYIETDLLGGSYVINVYDTKGCVGTTTATINPFIGIDFASPSAVTVTSPITCVNNEDIQVNTTFTGGAAVPLDYTIVATVDNPALGTVGNAIPYPTTTNSSGLFTNLTVGSYAITVTNPITGCSIKTIHYVNEPNTFDIIASNVQNVVCYGTATGSVDLTFVDNQVDPNDDAGAFEYTITGPTGPSPLVTTTGVSITIPNLPAGVYTVKAKLIAMPSCEVETKFTIAPPTAKLEIFETHTPITCDPGSDGTISVTADGGWPGNYQYELVGVGPGAISVAYSDQFFFENLTPGTYTVNVMDVNGCVDTKIVTLKDPDVIIVTANATAPLLACNGDTNGEIIVDLPTGGQGSNYSYILNYVSANPVFSSAPQTTPVFSGLSAGTYSVTVIDGLGCISQPTPDITISDPTKVEATLVLASGITCVNDATVTLSATGGTGPYEYSTDQNFGIVLGSFLSSITFSVGLGDHQYYVRDANGCVSYISNNVTINALTPLSLSTLDFTVIYCKGSETGIIDATAVGGLGNYWYTLLDSSKNPIRPAQATGYFDLLPAGKYIVRVDSGDCQYDSAEVEIKEPDFPLIQNKVVINVTCSGEGNGKIEIIASGGTGKITYAISPNLNQAFEGNVSGGHVFDNLKPGTYDYIVQDENGCFIYITGVEISEPNSIFVTTIPGTEMPEVCAGDADGAFSINVTGGNAPYSVSLDDVNGTYTSGTLVQTQFDFDDLSGSEHIVYVRDANNCATEHTVILGEAVTLNPQVVINYDCVNNSASNSVTVTVDASNLPADVDYALDGSTVFQASNVFTNVTPGQHTIDVRHANGCIKQVVFDVLQVDPLTLTLADGGLNEIVATATGGGGNYQYTLDGESYGTQSNFIIYKSGNYTVTVTDINGCTATATRYFEFIDIKIPNVFTPNGDGNNDTWAPTNTINYKDLVFEVYDRYGRKLGSYRESQFWDGKYNGNELPSGDYWYVIKIRDAKDAREFVGHFTLYR